MLVIVSAKRSIAFEIDSMTFTIPKPALGVFVLDNVVLFGPVVTSMNTAVVGKDLVVTLLSGVTTNLDITA
jgi:hypothetical protein